MIKLKRTQLSEEANDSLIGKKVIFRDNEVTIDEIEESGDDAFLTLSNGKKVSIRICVRLGNISTNDEDVKKFFDKFKDEEEDKPKEVKIEKSVRERAIEDANNDFFAKPKNRKFYDSLIKNGITWEYDRVYYETFKALEDSAIAKKKRNVTQTIYNISLLWPCYHS